MIVQSLYSKNPIIYETKSDSNLWIKNKQTNALYAIAYDPIPKEYVETEEPINVSTSD